MLVLLIEPFNAGSHAQLVDLLLRELGPALGELLPPTEPQPRVHAYTAPGKKWMWRARCSGLHFARVIPPLAGLRAVGTGPWTAFARAVVAHGMMTLARKFRRWERMGMRLMLTMRVAAIT